MKAKNVQSIICLVIFFLFSNQAWTAEWIYFDKAAVGDFYYDKNSIKKEDKNIISVWSKDILSKEAKTKYYSILKVMHKAPKNPSLLSYYKKRMQIDCANRKIKDISVIFYDEKGKVIYSSPKGETGEWNDILPDTVGEKLINIVSCEPVAPQEAIAEPKVEESVAPQGAVVAPKVEAPVVPNVAVVAPKVEAPVTPKEVAAVPKVEAPVAPNVAVVAPKVEAPVAPNVAVVAPKVEAPVTPKEVAAVPKVEAPVAPKVAVVTPKVKAPVTPKEVAAVPKVEAPVASKEATVVAPKVEAPIAPKVAVVTPKVEEPVAPQEAVVVPKIEAPVASKEDVIAPKEAVVFASVAADDLDQVKSNKLNWVNFYTSKMGNVTSYKKLTANKGQVKCLVKDVFSDEGREKYIQDRIEKKLSMKGYDKLSSAQSLNEIDCKKKMIMNISVSDFDKDEKKLDSYIVDTPKWVKIRNNSFFDILQKEVCK